MPDWFIASCEKIQYLFPRAHAMALYKRYCDLDITLADTGEILFAKIAKELSTVDVGKLFDRFYTVEAAHNSTGLGLSIVRTLIECTGGR